MSRQCVPSGYANLRIEYHANAVNVVCMKLKKRTPSSAAVEIDLIVSHTSENQPRMSQPSRSANAAITTTIASHVSQRRQAGRRAVDGGTAVASVAVAVGLDISIASTRSCVRGRCRSSSRADDDARQSRTGYCARLN